MLFLERRNWKGANKLEAIVICFYFRFSLLVNFVALSIIFASVFVFTLCCSIESNSTAQNGVRIYRQKNNSKNTHTPSKIANVMIISVCIVIG